MGLLPVTVLLTALVLAGAACGPRAGAPPGTATVLRVVDGDTIRARIGARDEAVRLLGIDTPESVKPGTPLECFAAEASNRTKALLPGGTRVRLVRDVEARDRFGRLLAYVYRARDGLFVNLALVREGFAAVSTHPPNVAHAGELRAAAAEARAEGRGLWRACDRSGEPPERPRPSAAAAVGTLPSQRALHR